GGPSDLRGGGRLQAARRAGVVGWEAALRLTGLGIRATSTDPAAPASVSPARNHAAPAWPPSGRTCVPSAAGPVFQNGSPVRRRPVRGPPRAVPRRRRPSRKTGG